MMPNDGPWHEVRATCKFCKKPITLEIADSYTHDHLKLIPLACCNACADNRIERRSVERKIQLVVTCLALAGSNKTEKLVETSRAQITKLTKAYAHLIAKWHRMEGELWEPYIVDQIMERPEQWGDTIGHMWRSFGQWKHRQGQQPSLPYSDT